MDTTTTDEATVFFTRRRTRDQLVALRQERYATHLREATRYRRIA